MGPLQKRKIRLAGCDPARQGRSTLALRQAMPHSGQAERLSFTASLAHRPARRKAGPPHPRAVPGATPLAIRSPGPTTKPAPAFPVGATLM